MSIFPSSSKTPVLSIQQPEISSTTKEDYYGECPICGDEYEENKRFGQKKTCKPCYSFFRRTVTENKQYKCKHNDKCGVKKAKNKHGCRYCRFERCLKNGMQVDALLNFQKDTYILEIGANSPLQRLVHCRRSNFTSRFRATIDFYGGAENFTNMANLPKTVVSCKNASKAELKVLEEFLLKSGFLIENEEKWFQTQLRNNFLFTWLSCEIVFNTIRHLGFNHKKSYFVDESFMEVDEDKIKVFLQQFDNFYDPQVLAESTMKMCLKVLDKAKRMYQLHIDETEMAAVVWILLLRAASRLRSSTQTDSDLPQNLATSLYSQKLNQLFCDLRHHYISLYEDVAIRFDHLMTFVEMIEDVKKSKEELAILTAINEVNCGNEEKVKGFEHRLMED